MITFEPDTPYEVGQRVTLHDGPVSCVKVVESIDRSEDGNEVQYHLVDEKMWELRQQGVRPWIELG